MPKSTARLASEIAASLRARDLERLGAGMASRSEVDCFGTRVARRARSEGQVSDRLVQRWARSRGRWWRRAGTGLKSPRVGART
jgi:hypothetical protein